MHPALLPPISVIMMRRIVILYTKSKLLNSLPANTAFALMITLLMTALLMASSMPATFAWQIYSFLSFLRRLTYSQNLMLLHF